MKLATSLAAALVLLCSGTVLAVGLGPALDLPATQAVKDAGMIGNPDPQPQVGGEDIATAANIPALPYSDSGNTCGYVNDYEATCPYTGSSPDVVYKYSPAADEFITIDLCTSLYDTKVYVFENDEYTEVGCNDDACGDDGWKSMISGLPVYAGNTYYICVDGYGSASCGDYNLFVDYFVPCVECPPGAQLEGEPFCGDDYDDVYNSGCNNPLEIFQPLPCGGSGTVTMCGVGGGFDYYGASYRDTDWFDLDPAINVGGVQACLYPMIDMIIGYITPADCASISTFDDYVYAYACSSGCINVPAGHYWLWIGATSFGGSVGCWDYNLEYTGYDCGPTAIEPSTWGQIKETYR